MSNFLKSGDDFPAISLNLAGGGTFTFPNNQMQTEVRENQKEETRGRKAFLRVDDKKELKDPPRI
jgi:hypothetical protein